MSIIISKYFTYFQSNVEFLRVFIQKYGMFFLFIVFYCLESLASSILPHAPAAGAFT